MKKLLPLIPFVAIISCQTNGDEPESMEIAPAAAEAEPATPEPAPIDVSKSESLVGLPLDKVQAACDAAGLRHRVIEIDGQSQPVTRDYRPERLNFAVKAGIIIAVSKG